MLVLYVLQCLLLLLRILQRLMSRHSRLNILQRLVSCHRQCCCVRCGTGNKPRGRNRRRRKAPVGTRHTDALNKHLRAASLSLLSLRCHMLGSLNLGNSLLLQQVIGRERRHGRFRSLLRCLTGLHFNSKVDGHTGSNHGDELLLLDSLRLLDRLGLLDRLSLLNGLCLMNGLRLLDSLGLLNSLSLLNSLRLLDSLSLLNRSMDGLLGSCLLSRRLLLSLGRLSLRLLVGHHEL